MNRIFAIGETVLDVLFRDGQPCKATPGGSMLNAAVTLGRLGTDIRFISEFGTDQVGGIVDRFLRDNGVNTTHVYRHADASTSVALAFMDGNSNASYQFYKPKPAVRLDVTLPEAGAGDYVLFGSFYALADETRKRIFPWIHAAGGRGALLLYDPNFRKPHLSSLEAVRPALLENLQTAHIVRASDEDCRLLFGHADAGRIYREYLRPDQVFICTSGGTSIVCCTGGRTLETVPPAVEHLTSTIGAGDTFNAGLAHGLLRAGITRHTLSAQPDGFWLRLMQESARFSAAVCASEENYLPQQTALACRQAARPC